MAKITNVELVAAGTWNASRGSGTVTAQDIASMAAASKHPYADRVPVKIGHQDRRFQDANGNPPQDNDGNPAYGWIENVRASIDGKTLLGDIVGIPPKLAEAMPTAFRHRSVEFQPSMRLGAQTFSAVLTAVALLGETVPAVKGLEDVLAMFSQRNLVSLSQGGQQPASLALRSARHRFLPEGLDESGWPKGTVRQFSQESETLRRAKARFFPGTI